MENTFAAKDSRIWLNEDGNPKSKNIKKIKACIYTSSLNIGEKIDKRV